MLRFEKKVTTTEKPHTTLVLDKDQREKSRLKVQLADGRQAGLFFKKGTSFLDGDFILSDDETTLVEIKAAPETLSTVKCDDLLQLARAAYHLGNRHVPLQIELGILRYQHDHVLDDMVRGLGLNVVVEEAPFEPESGAYSATSHASTHHHHTHNNAHSHSHAHE